MKTFIPALWKTDISDPSRGYYEKIPVEVPTEPNELETIILEDLVNDDPKSKVALNYWKELKTALKENDTDKYKDLTHKLYNTIFKKMNTYYWQHDYGYIVFKLVKGLREVTGIDPLFKDYKRTDECLPRNNLDGSGYDCAQDCHRTAGALLHRAVYGRICTDGKTLA